MTAFEYGAQYIKSADFRSDAARFVASKVVPEAGATARRAVGRPLLQSAGIGPDILLGELNQPRPRHIPFNHTIPMPAWKRVVYGAGAGALTGGLFGAYRGYTHNPQEPGVHSMAQGLLGGAAGGLLGGLTGHALPLRH